MRSEIRIIVMPNHFFCDNLLFINSRAVRINAHRLINLKKNRLLRHTAQLPASALTAHLYCHNPAVLP